MVAINFFPHEETFVNRIKLLYLKDQVKVFPTVFSVKIILFLFYFPGMNKMVVNHLEKLFVTNDAATIIKELEVFIICDMHDFMTSWDLLYIPGKWRSHMKGSWMLTGKFQFTPEGNQSG